MIVNYDIEFDPIPPMTLSNILFETLSLLNQYCALKVCNIGEIPNKNQIMEARKKHKLTKFEKR